MQVGDVKIAEDTDYAFFKAMCKVHEDWTNVYQKQSVSVWTKQNDVSDFKMIKVITIVLVEFYSAYCIG